jgi:hypothetical protein
MTYNPKGSGLGYASYGSPQDQAMRLAAAQLQEGSSTAPIRSKWQGVARLAQALQGGLGMRQAQQGGLDSNAAALKLAQAVSGGGMQGGAAGGGGLPAAPGALSDLVNAVGPVPDMKDSDFQGIPDSAIMGQGAQQGPPPAAMAPGNFGGPSPGAPPSPGGAMVGQNGMPQRGVQVASNDPNFMPSFPQPSPANASGGGGDAGFNPADMAMIQQDMQAVPGAAPQGGGSSPVGGPMGVVAQAETGNRNIPQEIHDINTDHGTPAQGNFQIIDPTWRQYAGKAGVDTSQYPSAIDAPPIVQAQVAAQIPVNQWGPNTIAALKARYPGLDVNGTLGEAQQQFGGQSPGQANFLRSSVAGPGAPSNIGPQGSDADMMQQDMQAAPGGQQGDQGGQGGGIPPAMMDGIKQIMLNPYASPEAKQMAEAMLQRYVQPQWETVNRPDGSVIAINKNNPSQNRMIAQPVRPSTFTQIGVDASGNPRYGFVNPATGQIQPADAQGGGGAPASPYVPRTVGGGQPPQGAPAPGGAPNIPAPNPAWTPGNQPQPQGNGSSPGVSPPGGNQPKPNSIATPDYTVKRTPGEDAIDQMAAQDPNPTNASLYTRARNIMLGNEPAPLIGVAGTKPVDVATMNIVRQADPNFNSAVATQRAENIKSWQDKTTPTSAGGQLLAANTSLSHVGTLKDASDALAPDQTNMQGVNSLQGWLASNFPYVPDAGTDVAAKRSAYETALQPVTEELTKLYSGGPGAEGDRQRMIASLSPDAPQPARDAAIKTLTTLLNGKVGALQNQWSQAGFAAPFPALDPDSQNTLTRVLGPQPGQPGSQGAQPGAQQGAPVQVRSQADYNALPAGAQYIRPDGTVHIKGGQ